jgi:hypothetical protein
MSATAKPYVWLQAASDAEMSLHATVIGIYTASSKGASATHPLIVVNNGWTFHHGTQVTLGNVGGDGDNDVLRGNTFLMSDTPATGTVSYFGTGANTDHPNHNYQASNAGNLAYRMPIPNGSSNFAFYITDLDGSALASDADATEDVQGVASVYLDDADPRKVYGLPYFFVSHDIGPSSQGAEATVIHYQDSRIGHDGTEIPPIRPSETNLTRGEIYPHHAYTLSSQLIPWPVLGGHDDSYTDLATGFAERGEESKAHPLQVGRNLNLTKNLGKFWGSGHKKIETLNVRTKWDWIAEHTASATPKTADDSSGVSVPGYAYGDSTVNYRRVISDVWRVGEGSGSSPLTANDYGAEIFTDSPSHLVAGQLFTVTNMKETVLEDLEVRYRVDAATPPAITGDIPNNLYFMVREMVGQFCIRTEAVKDTHVTDAVLGTVWVSQFVVNNSAFVGHPGQIAYDDDPHLSSKDSYSDIARAGVVAKGYAAHPDEIMNTPGRIPTTTRFQLHVESINHKYTDQVAVTPMVKSAGTKSSIFEQLQILGLNVGMRAESIDLSGTLRDTGPVGVDNLRKQVFLNIARTQWLKIMGFWGGKYGPQLDGDPGNNDVVGAFTVTEVEHRGYLHNQAKSEEFQSKGKGFGGPINPRSYACLTIFNPKEQSSDDGKKVDLNPDGGYNIYRGVIKNLSFSQEAGRPDVWTWRMTFEVISNEKLATTLYNTED